MYLMLKKKFISIPLILIFIIVLSFLFTSCSFFKNIKDSVFQYFINEELEKVTGIELDEKINSEDYEKITVLNENGKNINNIKGIEILINLENINLSNNNIQDIKYLGTLVNLKFLNLNNNIIINITP